MGDALRDDSDSGLNKSDDRPVFLRMRMFLLSLILVSCSGAPFTTAPAPDAGSWGFPAVDAESPRAATESGQEPVSEPASGGTSGGTGDAAGGTTANRPRGAADSGQEPGTGGTSDGTPATGGTRADAGCSFFFGGFCE